MTHPLTDKKVQSIWDKVANETSGGFTQDDLMRAAYDLGESKGRAEMLEQVIEWLQENLWLCDDEQGPLYVKEDFLSDMVVDEEKVIKDLKQAICPQENN